MAKTILLDASITVDGVDLSDRCSAVEIEDSSEEVDVTAFGAANREILLGLGDGTITATFFQDFASGSVDSVLSQLKGSNTPFEVVVKPTSGPVGPDNPSYTMQAVLPTYNPVSGSVGEASTIEASFRNASPSGIVRATS